MLKEIGIFSFLIPVVGLLMSIVCRLILGIDAVETSVNFYGFFYGDRRALLNAVLYSRC